ncbi:MAG: hypothetical protein ACU0CQ_05265 [Sulfitobacter sp.]|jgi:hypothetical protein|uniref:hypothetical protein n=1 Tax=Sulfitobacter sp. TaxID=1903071 RepID=UPI004059D87F|tara:strand:- start:1422 stop:1769 length:348 start_codon:yes stop_codon:yes gene_type:complete
MNATSSQMSLRGSVSGLFNEDGRQTIEGSLTNAPADASATSVWPAWMTRKRVIFASAATLLGGGMALNWGWLTAVGLAPILISLAPCAAMCGLGLCMKGGTGKGCGKSTHTSSSE